MESLVTYRLVTITIFFHYSHWFHLVKTHENKIEIFTICWIFYYSGCCYCKSLLYCKILLLKRHKNYLKSKLKVKKKSLSIIQVWKSKLHVLSDPNYNNVVVTHNCKWNFTQNQWKSTLLQLTPFSNGVFILCI